jgi:Domain of unknown function (DUF4214)/Glycosyl hydrolase catalytic core
MSTRAGWKRHDHHFEYRRSGKRTLCNGLAGLVAAIQLVAVLLPIPAIAAGDIVWGVNGHPLVSYPGVSFEQQLDLLSDLGAKSYRVDVTSADHAGPLGRLIAQGAVRGIDILPVLIPPVDLAKEEPAVIYEKSKAFARLFAGRFKSQIRVWELGNEHENFAIIQPCEMQDDGKQYNCAWGPASGVGRLEYFGPRWVKVSAVLKGLSDGVNEIDPTARKAIGTAGWGHIGAFERMQEDGIAWDISVWHFYGDDPEWGLERVAPFGKPIWITEFNHSNGSLKGEAEQATGLRRIMKRFDELKAKYNIEAAHVYELLDQSYWGPDFEAFMGLVRLAKTSAGQWTTERSKPAFCAAQTHIKGGFRQRAAAHIPSQGGSGQKQSTPQRSCDLCLLEQREPTPRSRVAYSYCLVLGRDADGGGLAGFAKDVEKGAKLYNVLDGMLSSSEFSARYQTGPMSPLEIVIFYHRLLLDRDPQPAVAATFEKMVRDGIISRQDLALQIIDSAEFRRLHTQLFDAVAK